MSDYSVYPGQIWADNDKRCKGRTLRVEEIYETHARCTVVTKAGNVPDGQTQVRILLRRFRPVSTGYRLVEDVAR